MDRGRRRRETEKECQKDRGGEKERDRHRDQISIEKLLMFEVMSPSLTLSMKHKPGGYRGEWGCLCLFAHYSVSLLHHWSTSSSGLLKWVREAGSEAWPRQHGCLLGSTLKRSPLPGWSLHS